LATLILDAYKSSPKGKGAKTPAKPSERIKGSKKNKEGSASKANSKIEVGSVLESLKEKVSSHNKKYGKEKGKRVTLRHGKGCVQERRRCFFVVRIGLGCLGLVGEWLVLMLS
jgi:hypothetical protein